MALTLGTNSYVTLDDAEDYFEYRLDVAAWVEADCTMREQALVTATYVLDAQPWVGYVASDTQALAWPRCGTFHSIRGGRRVDLSELGDYPNQLKRATYELAYHLLNNDGLLDGGGSSLESLSVGSISLDFGGSSGRTSTIPATVRREIRDLLTAGIGRSWVRVN